MTAPVSRVVAVGQLVQAVDHNDLRADVLTNHQHVPGGTEGGIIAHTSLSAIGTNTHAAIDTHIAATNGAHGKKATTEYIAGAWLGDYTILAWNQIVVAPGVSLYGGVAPNGALRLAPITPSADHVTFPIMPNSSGVAQVEMANTNYIVLVTQTTVWVGGPGQEEFASWKIETKNPTNFIMSVGSDAVNDIYKLGFDIVVIGVPKRT